MLARNASTLFSNEEQKVGQVPSVASDLAITPPDSPAKEDAESVKIAATPSSLTLFSPHESKEAKEISISPAAQEILQEDLLIEIASCLSETNKYIKTCSALPGYEENAEQVEKAREKVKASVYNILKSTGAAITAPLLLRLIYNALKTQGAGNCFEFSLFASHLLNRKGIENEIFRIKGGDHVFLVVNRKKSTPVSDYTKWNKDTVIVDPLFSCVYMVHELPQLLKSCSYSLSKVNYVPFDPDSHQLDNGVIEGLVEDWQAVREAVSQAITVSV